MGTHDFSSADAARETLAEAQSSQTDHSGLDIAARALSRSSAYFAPLREYSDDLLRICQGSDQELDALAAGTWSSFSIMMVPRMTSAAIAPIAASCGASNAPTTPAVRGMSTSALPSSLRMTMRRMLPARMTSLIFAMSVSPLNWNSSVRGDMVDLLVKA